MRKFFLVFLLAMIPLAAFGQGNADLNALPAGFPTGNASGGKNDEEAQWLFTADKVVAQHDSEFLQAWGNATLRSGSNYLRADFVRYYQSTKWVYMKGHVQAKWEGDFYQADEAEFDLSNMVGWLKNGKVFVAQPHLYFESAMIRKLKGDSYTFKDAKVSACSGEKPAWSFTAQEGHITLDGYAQLWHARFNIKDVTVMYTPYMQLPTQQERQTGLLIPEIQSSSRNGYGVNIPLYINLGDERDMTLYENFMSERGFMTGLEYRSATNVESKGLWRADYLNDWMTEAELAPKYRFDDGLDRDNRDRFWIRSKYNGYLLDPAWKTKLDIDFVSDQDYLREFKDGYSGYDQSREEFLREFNRGLEVHDSMNRTSTAMISRSWEKYGVVGRADYKENLAYRNGNNPPADNPTIQTVPSIDLYAFKESLWGSIVEWEGQAGFDHFWRERGTTGSRFDIRPRINVPLKTGGFTFIPSMGFRQTMWLVNKFEDEDDEVSDDRTPSRFVPEAGVEAFTELYRVYDLGGIDPGAAQEGDDSWTKLLHSIQPRVSYNYASDSKSEQEDRPYFDREDRDLSTNQLSYSLTNVFDRRRDTVTVDPDNLTSKPVIKSDYKDFARVRVEQGYDFNEAVRTDELNEYPRRPFSDILTEVIINPLDWVQLTSRTWISPYGGDVTEHEHMLRVHHQDWGSLYFGYDYLAKVDEYKRRNDKNLQILRLGGRAFLTSRLWVDVDFRKDLYNDQELEKSVGFTWDHECFRVTLKYSDTSTDQRFEVMFDLITF